ncbi:MAG: UDP-glucose 4-epimerase GalE [Gilvibacter sp.]
MKILVTGGLGYIGSHTVVALQQEGHEVFVIDDLSNTTIQVKDNIESISGKEIQFTKLDLKDRDDVYDYFNRHSDIDGLIHFAASKAVNESIEDPLKYYENNINTLVYLLKACRKHDISNFIFSSSCTVYGEPDSLPITEGSPVKVATSPYGNSKQIGEEILLDTSNAADFKVISLRYFNPIGAHESAAIGELPVGVPQNLVPFITQTAAGIREQLLVFGDNYPTQDGSCIRDYIHVVDLAEAHVKALDRLLNNDSEDAFEIFNVGTGKGTSVLEIINAFEQTTGQKLNYKIVDRRPGDVMQIFADTTKANEVLGWSARLSLQDCLTSAWKWEQNCRN